MMRSRRAMPDPALCGTLAYIDPTGGLPPSVWGMYLAALLSALGMSLAMLRVYSQALGRYLRRHLRAVLTVAALLVGGSLMAFWFSQRPSPAESAGRKVLILGLDGLDPQLLDRYLAEGRLPNLARLA